MYTSPTYVYDYDQFGMIFQLLNIAISIFTLVATCKVYTKLGLPWWSAIIPIYNLYVLAKRVWDEKNAKTILWLDIATLALSVVLIFVTVGVLGTAILYGISSVADPNSYTPAVMTATNGLMMTFLFALALWVVAIVLLVWEVRLYNRVSKAFGHGEGFTVGLILLAPIFWGILAFGGTETPIDQSTQSPTE